MFLEWLPSQVSWALSLLKASCLNHLILPANLQCSHIQRQLLSRLPADHPPPSLSQLTEKRGPPTISSCPLSFLSSSFPPPSRGLWTFILIFNRNFSSPADPLRSFVFVWSLYLYTFQGHKPRPLSSLPPPSFISKPAHALLCPLGGFVYTSLLLFDFHPLSTFCPSSVNIFCFQFFTSQCLTSSSWLVFQAVSVMEVPVVKIREGEAGAEEKTMIKSIVNMVQYSVWLCVTVWHVDGKSGNWCMSYNSQCMTTSVMVN